MKRFIHYLLLFLAIGLGIATGLSEISLLHKSAEVISEIFMRLLRLLSLPIIFLSIAATISGMKDFRSMRKIGRRVLTYTLGTTLVAAAVALLFFLVIAPTRGAQVAGEVRDFVHEQGSYLSFMINIVPSNLAQAFLDNNVIGIAFVALFFSFALLVLPQKERELLHKLFQGLFGAVLKMTEFIIAPMPLAIWAFVTLLIKDLQTHHEAGHLGLYLICILGANLFQGLVVLPLLLKAKGVSPWRTFKGMLPALTVAFFSKSSNATLPLTMQMAEEKVKVSREVSSFTLPLCSVINMNGCAAFILTTVLFVASLNGLVFGAFDYVIWIFLATLAAVGNAGVPMGCFFLTSAFLIGMKVPLYMMGLILPFYTFLDMVETALNVWSDATIAVVVDQDLKGEEEILQQVAE